jgi:colanic acid/amylovoran biosynthesis glycosyltransferase
MIVAYLVNQYPHVSHTFIRREIAALEAQGFQVERFSIRPAPRDLIDPADIAEAGKTHVILAQGIVSLLSAVILMLVMHPIKWFRALAEAIRMGRRSDRGVLRHLVYLVEACHLVKYLTVIRVKHLHAHFGTNSATVALLASKLGGPPYSFTVHGPEEFDKPESLSLGDKIRSAKFVVAISSFGRSQLCRWSRPEDWHKLKIVRCGLDADFISTSQTSVPNTARFVCVGRLSEQKGQLVLLEAADIVRRNHASLEIVLAGDGPMRGQFEQRIAELKLASAVRITGWLTNAQVRELIQSSRAMVQPSFAEGLPVVIMEALALGRPIISTYIAGIPELVQAGVNGWLVPAGAVDALAQAMQDALATPIDRLNQMGAAGADAVRRQHSAASEAAVLAELFRQPKANP